MTLRFSSLLWTAAAFLAAAPLHAAEPTACTDNDPTCARNVSVSFVSGIVGAPASAPLSGDRLDRRTDEVARKIRCPVCQGSSIGDSPSSTARNMKNQVHDLLAAGFSEEQVFAYFEASYGEFIRLAPKAEGFTLVVWILPALLLLLGGFIAYGYLRDRTRKPATQEAAPAARPAEDADLDPWLRRVREMSGTGES